MAHPEFIIASVDTDRHQLIDLNVEYMSWVFSGINQMFDVDFENLIGISARDYVPTVIDEICGRQPPDGIFYRVSVGGELAGMGGLCRINPAKAEIKRIYIREAFRGQQVGRHLLDRLFADARAFGYSQVCLNTALFMKAAHRLYEQNGFVDCPAYEEAEVPADFMDRWRFMERTL